MIIGTHDDPLYGPEVPLEFCPALATVYNCWTNETPPQEFNITRVHRVGKADVWLYPEGNEFARATCEELSRNKQ